MRPDTVPPDTVRPIRRGPHRPMPTLPCGASGVIPGIWDYTHARSNSRCGLRVSWHAAHMMKIPDSWDDTAGGLSINVDACLRLQCLFCHRE